MIAVLFYRFLQSAAVRPSVCPSISHVCVQTANDVIKLISHPGSTIILVSLIPSADTKLHEKPLQQWR